MACHHIKDPETGLWVYIPECYGAIHDPDGCTCSVKGSDLEQAILDKQKAEDRAEAYLQSAQSMREQNIRLMNQNSQLRKRLTELKQLST